MWLTTVLISGVFCVMQLWEEDLADFDDLWPVTAGAANAAAGDDSEDSNAGGTLHSNNHLVWCDGSFLMAITALQ